MTMTKTIFRLRRWWRRRRAAGARGVHQRAPSVDVDAAERLLGPGWFDSSWDLQSGLEVREGLPANASVNEWLAASLGPTGRWPA